MSCMDRERSREALREWASGPSWAPIRRGHLQLMTPVLAVGTVVFAALGGWTEAAIAAVATLIGANGLRRERRLRIERERPQALD
jgi:hypothetical protein